MKYIIKCPYCGTTYTVDVKQQKQTFMCRSCGAQNSTKDALEKVEEPVTREQLLSEEEARKLRLRKLWEKEDAKRDTENVLVDVPMSEGTDELNVNFSSILPILWIFIVFAFIWGAGVAEQDKREARRMEQEREEWARQTMKENRWKYTWTHTIDDMITIETPYYISQTEDDNVLVTNNGKVTYRVHSISVMGSRTPQEAYEEQLGIYMEQKGLQSYSKEVDCITMNDWSEGYVGCINVVENEQKIDYEVLILPYKNVVVTLSMEYAADYVPEDDVEKLAKHVVVLAGDEDVVSGKVLTEADGSTLILNENGTYTYYPFKDTATSVCASGNYDVYYGMEAIFELACMTNYGFTEEALQKEVYENMNGYVLNGETTENADTYYICVDSFYTLILHQNQVMEDEAITALQADTVYAGYYVSKLGVLDMTNADTTEAVLFRTPEATYTYNIYDREIQVQDIYLDSSKEIYCQEDNPYQDKLLLQFELVAQKETMGASGFEFNRIFGFTTLDNSEIEFLQDATEGICRIHIANSDGSQRDYYYKEDEEVRNLCKLINKALVYENERNG